MRKADVRPKGQPVTMWLSEELVVKADELARKVGISRSRLLAQVMEASLHEVYLCDKIGVFDFGLIMRAMKSQLRGWVTCCLEEPENVSIKHLEGVVEWRDGKMVERSLEEVILGTKGKC